MFWSLSSRLRALGGLEGPSDLPLFLRVSAFAALVPLLMRLPLPRLAMLLARPASPRSVQRTEVERLERLMTIAPRVGWPIVRPGCLTRGVTLFWFLRRAGLGVELCFGLDPADDAPDGHCWLVVDGEPFLEKVDPRSRFVELYRLPLRSA